jgi:arylsulfatase A-like enzyme
MAGIFILSACGKTTPVPEATAAEVEPLGTPVPYTTTIFDIETGKASQARLDDERPNIIFILTDDQPYETVQFMPTVRDVLIKDGVNFENGFVTTSLCCPSRVSILTGEYVHNHKVYTDRMPLGGAPKFDDTSSVATWLQDAGYRTAYYGKYLNDYDALTPLGYVPPGWSEWGAFLGRNLADDDEGSASYYTNYSLSENGKVVEYTQDNSVFGADMVTRNAVDFIASAKDEPFFMFVGYYNPHSPYKWAERHDPQFRLSAELQADQYRPPDFMEEDRSDKPKYLQELKSISVEKIDITYKQILRSLLAVDDGVASILNALDKTGVKEKTVIVYLTDNGTTVGNHGFGITKNCAYEACLHVPFIVYSPMFAPRSEIHLAANIDLAPTFADLAGAPIPDTVDGISLLPLLQDPNAPWRADLLFEHWPTEAGVGSKIPEFYAVRNSAWKYVEYSTGEKELYDLKNDPYELQNVAGQAQYAEIQSQLQKRLEELKQE